MTSVTKNIFLCVVEGLLKEASRGKLTTSMYFIFDRRTLIQNRHFFVVFSSFQKQCFFNPVFKPVKKFEEDLFITHILFWLIKITCLEGNVLINSFHIFNLKILCIFKSFYLVSQTKDSQNLWKRAFVLSKRPFSPCTDYRHTKAKSLILSGPNSHPNHK